MTQFAAILIATIIALLAKELAVWLFSLIKNLSSNKAIKAKLSNMFTINILFALINVVLGGLFAWTLGNLINDPAPLDRSSVFNIAAYTSLVLLCFIRVENLIASDLRERRDNKQKQRQIERANESVRLELAEKIKKTLNKEP